MKAWLYKWLPIICGCHCKEERSFHYKGKRFPVCARCTGELVGMLVSLITCFFFRPPLWACFVLMIPMVVDGTVQMFTKYESNNRRRFITGFLFGYGFFMIFAIMTVLVWHLGVEYGKTLRER